MIKNSKILHILLIAVLFTGIISCNSSETNVDLSEVNISMKLDRFEQSLFNSRSVNQVLALSEEHRVFYPVYLFNIMPGGNTMINKTAGDHAAELYDYISHPDMGALYDFVQEKYGDFENYRSELEMAAKHINYYFPDEKIERTITYVSTFEYASVFLDDDKVFAIGLDMYMGRDFEIYPYLSGSRFPSYRINKFEAQYIVPNAVQSFLNYKVKRAERNSFIDEAVFEGKKLYALDLILPNTTDSLKIAYAKGQLEWCHDNAENIWAYFIEKDILFSSDKNAYTNKFFNDGPFTAPFGHESAPRVGAWIGWQIVKAYMDKNPEVKLSDLVKDTDHQKIFKSSRYKP